MQDVHYYYLHTNGDLIHKPSSVVDSDPEYFNSDFVKHVWTLVTENRHTAWMVVLEALALGANIPRCKELSSKWGLTLDDSVDMLKHVKPTPLEVEGMKIFIPEVLGLEEDTYWKMVFERWGEGSSYDPK